MTLTEAMTALQEQHPEARYRLHNGAIYTEDGGRWYGIYSTIISDQGPQGQAYPAIRDGRTVLPVMVDRAGALTPAA